MENDVNMEKNRMIAVISAIAIIAFFFSAFILCYLMYGNDPAGSTQLTASTSILSSTLTFVVLIYAVIMWKDGKTSEIYRERYMKEKELEDMKKK